ncbi:MAG: hypothetical protein IJD36_04360, partial [Clostridia bacterium]|nr:hypothetical protein [Clostridia bacterium]
MDALKWLWNYVRKYRLSLVFILILTGFFIAGAFITPIVMGHIVDDIIIAGNYGPLFFYLCILLLSVIIKECAIYIRYLIMEDVAQGSIKSI